MKFFPPPQNAPRGHKMASLSGQYDPDGHCAKWNSSRCSEKSTPFVETSTNTVRVPLCSTPATQRIDLDDKKVAVASSCPNRHVKLEVLTKFEPVMKMGLRLPLRPTFGMIPEIFGGTW